MEELLAGLVPGMPEPLRAQILARAEGVPLYAVETVRMLLDRGLLAQEGSTYSVVGEVEDLEVPETLHALIAARLDGLSEDERRLLQDGAVLGKSFSRGTLAALAGRRRDRPRAASRLARAQGGALAAGRRPLAGARQLRLPPGPRAKGRLRHAVAARPQEPPSGRGRPARRLAGRRGSRGGDRVPSTGGLRGRAGGEGRRGAEEAGRPQRSCGQASEPPASAAFAEAQRYFEQAEELAADEQARADLAARAGEVAWRANKPEECRALLERAHSAYEELGDPVAAARVASRLADGDFIDGHPPQAVKRLEPALAALEAAGASTGHSVGCRSARPLPLFLGRGRARASVSRTRSHARRGPRPAGDARRGDEHQGGHSLQPSTAPA